MATERRRPSLFAPDLVGGLVVTKSDEFCVAEVIVDRPFKKLDLCDQNWLQPAAVLAGHVASLIGHEPGKALFVGLYAIGASRPMTRDEFWRVPAYIEMKAFGMKGSPRTGVDHSSSGSTSR